MADLVVGGGPPEDGEPRTVTMTDDGQAMVSTDLAGQRVLLGIDQILARLNILESPLKK